MRKQNTVRTREEMYAQHNNSEGDRSVIASRFSVRERQQLKLFYQQAERMSKDLQYEI
jgi:hypothetical protein